MVIWCLFTVWSPPFRWFAITRNQMIPASHVENREFEAKRTNDAFEHTADFWHQSRRCGNWSKLTCLKSQMIHSSQILKSRNRAESFGSNYLLKLMGQSLVFRIWGGWLDKPALLTIRVLWFLFLIVRRVPRPSESGCKKCNGLKKYLLGHTFSWKRLSAILCPWNPPWWWFFSLKLNKKCLKTPSKIKGLSFISSNLGNMDFFLIFNCISH